MEQRRREAGVVVSACWRRGHPGASQAGRGL